MTTEDLKKRNEERERDRIAALKAKPGAASGYLPSRAKTAYSPIGMWASVLGWLSILGGLVVLGLGTMAAGFADGIPWAALGYTSVCVLGFFSHAILWFAIREALQRLAQIAEKP